LALAALSRSALRRSTSSRGGRTWSAEVGIGSLKGVDWCRAAPMRGTSFPASPAEDPTAAVRPAPVRPAAGGSAGKGSSAEVSAAEGSATYGSLTDGSTAASAALRSARLSGCPVIQVKAGSSESDEVSRTGSGCGSERLAGVGELSFTAASLPLGSALPGSGPGSAGCLVSSLPA
jgi:hypothetical protein